MHKLNKLTASISSQSRRDFLTHSSMAMIGMAVCSILPSPVLAATTAVGTSLSHLDSLSLYVSSSDAVPGRGVQNFSESVDEARYLSQVLFQELMKYEFQYNHYNIAYNLGFLADTTMIGWGNVQHIFTLHKDYFTSHMAEYISAMLQGANRTNTSMTLAQRLPSNTWDMAKANQTIDIVEKGFEYRQITDKLYSACLHKCKSPDAYALSGYITPDARWAHELKNHYMQSSTLEALIDELRAEESGLTRFTRAQQKIDGIINKISILNRAARENYLSDSDIEALEQRMFGVVFSGIAQSMKWGSSSEADSVLGRSESFDEVVAYLRNPQNGSEEVATFWNSFFSTTTTPIKFWSELATMGLTNYSLRDSFAKGKITTKYSELGTSKGTVLLNGFLLLLGISHFSWATSSDDGDSSSPVKLTELGVTFISTGVSVLYDALVTKVAWKLVGNSNATSAAYFSNFSKFMNKVRGTGNVFSNKARLRAEKLFNSTSIGNFIGKVSLALAAIGAVVAVWTLATAIVEGDTAGIVFASLNLVASVLGVLAMALSWTGPVAVAIAIVGLLLWLAEWLYNLFKPTPPPPNPYADFTNQVMRNKQLVLGLVGSFLCRTSWGAGTKLSKFDITNMNYDWANQNSIAADAFTQNKALITDKTDGYKTIYNFSNFSSARKGSVSTLFTTGVSSSIPNWAPNFRFNTCTCVAQSVSNAWGKQAMFAVTIDYPTTNPRLYVSGGLDKTPSFAAVPGIDYENEKVLDIVGLTHSSLFEPSFIIFTNKNIYQYYFDEQAAFKVVSRYDLDPNGSGEVVSAITALETGYKEVSYYLQTNLDNMNNVYHFTLNGAGMTLNKVNHIRTTSAKLAGASSAINVSSGIAGLHIADVSAPRTYGLACSTDFLSRFGVFNNSDNAKTTCYNDVAFKLSNHVFYGFYKNAYIPA